MATPSVRVIGVILVFAVLGAVGYQVYISAEADGLSSAAESTTPPTGAAFVDEDAGTIIAGVMSARRKEQRDEIAAYYEGAWIPSEGWEHEVVDVTRETKGTAVRMYTTTGGGIIGGYYTVAVFPVLDQPVSKGDRVRYQGMIKRVEMLPAGAVPMQRILLHNCRLISVTRGR
jgi:hypothetical protein